MAVSVNILVPAISGQAVGVALRLARYLVPEFSVDIVAPDWGAGVMAMYRDAWPYRIVACPRMYRYPDFFWESRQLQRALTGDIIVAVKAYANTVPLALAARRQRGARAVVVLDEWDGAHGAMQSRWQRSCDWMRHAWHPLSIPHHARVERLIPQADLVLSTTTFLQRRFGGEVIAMGPDTDFFKPQAPDQVLDLRRKLGLDADRVLVFGGIVRPHKGVELILEALVRSRLEHVKLLVVGPRTEHLDQLAADPRYAALVAVAGGPVGDDINKRIHDQMPLYLDLADLVVIPLADTPLAQSQMPIKIFEAMAMAKPIIATAVSDLPAILHGCGRLAPPGDVDALARLIRELLADPAAARAMGRSAREKCAAQYSQAVTSAFLRRRMAALM